MRPTIVPTLWHRLGAEHRRRMDRVRALQESASGEPVRVRYPLRGGDPDKRTSSSPPPGWPGTSAYGSIFREQF